MIMTSSSSFRPSMKASLLSRVQLVQSNLALLPLDKGELSATNPFIPSAVDFWTPEDAIRNHTSRDLRFDQVHLIERWNGGETDSFVLNGKVVIFLSGDQFCIFFSKLVGDIDLILFLL